MYKYVPNSQLNYFVTDIVQQYSDQFSTDQNRLPIYPPFMTHHYECNNPLLFVIGCQECT